MRLTNWYAAWSWTVALLGGVALLLVADSYGWAWCDAHAERDLLRWRVEQLERVALDRTNALVACAQGRYLSFPGLLVFCDPYQVRVGRGVAHD